MDGGKEGGRTELHVIGTKYELILSQVLAIFSEPLLSIFEG